MEKVKCNACGNTGYTASPERVTCQCGGKLRVIEVKGNSKNK